MRKITFLCQTSHYYVENKKKSKLLSFNCFYTEYSGGSLLFTIQFPEIPFTHFIDLGRIKS